VKKGEVVTCTVKQVLDNGIEVQLTGGAIGFIRKAELSRDRSEQQPSRFAVGEKLDARVTAVDPRARKIALSIKQREIAEEKKAVADYGSSESGASLGDILGAAFSKAAEAKKASDDNTVDETAPEAPEQEEVPEADESEEAVAELAVEAAEAEDATEKKSSKKAAAAEEAAEEQATEEQAAEDVADDAAEEAAEDAPEAGEEAPVQDTAEAESDDSKKD
jgi:small subunit ribosomal protein S1